MNKSAILFNKEHVKAIEFDHRLPPTSIGVRRLRPSSKEVTKELKRQKRAKKERKANQEARSRENDVLARDMESTTRSITVDEIRGGRNVPSSGTSDTNEILALDDTSTAPELDGNSTKKMMHDGKERGENGEIEASFPCSESQDSIVTSERSETADTTATKQYFQFDINKQLIQEEIDEIKGTDRSAYNNLPALLSPPMTRQACHHGFIPEEPGCPPRKSVLVVEKDSSSDSPSRKIRLDDNLASRWASTLQCSMRSAEDSRSKESMRPMAYRLIPEAWSRLRPIPGTATCSCTNSDKVNDGDDDDDLEAATTVIEGTGDIDEDGSAVKDDNSGKEQKAEVIFTDGIHHQYAPGTSSCNPTDSRYDIAHDVLYDYMYNNFSNIHVSCGSKFGCDYLLYDGNRKERHAFAGLRVFRAVIDNTRSGPPVCSGEREHERERDKTDGGYIGSDHDIEFPLPTAYDMHGFVRSMNTAGKLALLAMIVESKMGDHAAGEQGKIEDYRVAFVDLALEKVLNAPTHLRKRKRGAEARKQIGQNLAKKC